MKVDAATSLLLLCACLQLVIPLNTGFKARVTKKGFDYGTYVEACRCYSCIQLDTAGLLLVCLRLSLVTRKWRTVGVQGGGGGGGAFSLVGHQGMGEVYFMVYYCLYFELDIYVNMRASMCLNQWRNYGGGGPGGHDHPIHTMPTHPFDF